MEKHRTPRCLKYLYFFIPSPLRRAVSQTHSKFKWMLLYSWDKAWYNWIWWHLHDQTEHGSIRQMSKRPGWQDEEPGKCFQWFFFFCHEDPYCPIKERSNNSKLNCLGNYGNYLLFGVFSLSLLLGNSYFTSHGPWGVVSYRAPFYPTFFSSGTKVTTWPEMSLSHGKRTCCNRRDWEQWKRAWWDRLSSWIHLCLKLDLFPVFQVTWANPVCFIAYAYLSWTFVTKSSWLIQELLQNSQAWASQVEFLMQLVINGVEACMFFLNFSELYLPAQTENHYFLFLSEFQVHRADLIILSSRHVIIVGPCNVPLLLIPFHHHTPPPFSLPPKITILTY